MSFRRKSGIAERIAGSAIGADTFLPNMASDAFFSCLSRTALEATDEAAGVPVETKLKIGAQLPLHISQTAASVIWRR